MTYLSEYEKQAFTRINQKFEQVGEIQKFNTHQEFAQLEHKLQKEL